LIKRLKTSRWLISALAASVVLFVAFTFSHWPVEATGGSRESKQLAETPSFRPDALTGIIRDKRRRLVRVDLKNDRDLVRAADLGTIVQNFGSFAVVSQPNTSNTSNASDKAIDTTIGLPGTSFDPITSLRAETVGLNAKPDSGYFIVQFGGVVTDDWLNDLRSAGVEILQYVPHQAFLVYAEADAIAKTVNHPRVRWVGRYLAEEKMSPVLGEQIKAATYKRSPKSGISALSVSKENRAYFDIAVFARANIETVAAQLGSQFVVNDLEIDRLPNNFFNVIRVSLSVDKVPDVANMADVIRIDAAGVRQAEDERAAQIVAGNYSSATTINPPGYDPLSQFGVDGTGVTVALSDDGVNIPGNGGFYLTASNTSNGPLRGAAAGATSGHGHLNASIIAGSTPFGILDPLGYNYGLGIAPKANILNIPLLVSGYSASDAVSYDDSVSTVGVNGVRPNISNDSWGNGTNMNAYDSLAAEYDGFARDSSSAGSIDPLLLVFSAGNNGPSTKSLTRPKVAKNVISVGNSENLRTEFSASGANNIDDLNASSSRGPTADGRVKPDVTAPGSYVTGSRAGDCSGVTNCFDANHAYSVGTSHAAPQVSGAAALFTQFWRNNNGGLTPSPAMIKAAIINSAQEMNGFDTSASIPNGNEGWGRLNMKQMFGPGVTPTYIDGTATLSSVGSNITYAGSVVDTTKPVKITLVWTDPPAVADPALVNDLDLAVTIGGSTYRGNNLTGGVSTAGGTSNSVDNVENVILLPGIAAGTKVFVSVTAAALNGDGVLGNADLTDQNFALVLNNFALDTTAAPANISGRVTDRIGIGIPRTSVSLTNNRGEIEQTAMTNSFGYYQFPDVRTGESYIITVRNKKYVFSPQSIFYNHFDEISDMNFVASER